MTLDLLLVARRHLMERPARSVMVAVSVALGVAVFLGVNVGTATMDKGLDRVAGAVGGRADVLVRSSIEGRAIDQSTVAAVAALPGVLRTEPAYATAASLGRSDTNTYVVTALVGIEPGGHSLTGATTAGGRLPTSDSETALSDDLAGRLGVSVGDVVVSNDRELTVTGILLSGALTNATGGETAVMTPSALHALGAGRPVQLLLELEDGTGTDSWLRDRRGAVPGVHLEDATAFITLFDDTTVADSLSAISMVSLLMAIFLIYLAFSTSVNQRVRTYGTLAALGATGRQITGVVLVEALLLGVVGTAAGLVLGGAVAVGLTSVMGNLFGVPMPPVRIPLAWVAIATVGGVVTSVMGAWGPARQARRLAPAIAMGGTPRRRAPRRTVTAIGTVVAVGGVVLGAQGNSDGTSMGVPLAILGITVALPGLLPVLAILVRPIARRIVPGVGDIAVEHLVRERSRSATTASLVTAVIAIVIVVGTTYTSVAPQFGRYMRTQYGSDIQIDGGALGVAGTPIPAGLPDEIRAMRGVSAVAPMWHLRAPVVGVDGNHVVTAVDPGNHFRTSGYLVAEGSADRLPEVLGAGGSVLVPHGLAMEQAWHPGDEIAIETPGGAAPFVIAATYGSLGDDYSRALVVSRDDAARWFELGPASELRVDVGDGYAAREVSDEIRRASPELGLRHRLGSDNVAKAVRQFDGVFAVFLVILALAALIGMLGIANTMAISVIDRGREIGLLRAVGTQASEIRRMVVTEGVALVVVAFLVAIALTLPLSRGTSPESTTRAFGIPASAQYPWLWLPVILLVAASAAALACRSPARRAAGLDVVASLRLD